VNKEPECDIPTYAVYDTQSLRQVIDANLSDKAELQSSAG
jgi:hypothetical protein